MTLVDLLNAGLFAALVVIVFKLGVILFRKTRDAFYIPPEPIDFSEDEEDEDHVFEEEEVEKGAVTTSEKVQCPYCGLKVIQLPEVDANANCSLCKKNVMTDI